MDILKLIMLIIGAILIVLIGINIKNKYYNKCQLIKGLLDVTELLEIEISFSKKSIDEILINKINDLDDNLKKLFEKYLQYKTFHFVYLSNNENQEINNFFNALGECDADIELNKLASFKTKLLSYKDKYHNQFYKNGLLSFKLSICAALLFIVLFA